jgi:hypothetical protein
MTSSLSVFSFSTTADEAATTFADRIAGKNGNFLIEAEGFD